MQVHCDEGIANRIGPEPCVVGREAGGEASAGVRIGQPLSRERINRDADAVVTAEGKTGMRVNASAYGRRPWHVRYDLKRLVYVERYERIIDAIQRDSKMKHWPRAWKVRLILDTNPRLVGPV